jgi:hypothetical protein
VGDAEEPGEGDCEAFAVVLVGDTPEPGEEDGEAIGVV